MAGSARGKRKLDEVAALVAAGDVPEAAKKLTSAMSTTKLYAEPGDLDDRLKGATILASYVFATRAYLDATEGESTPWYRSSSKRDDLRSSMRTISITAGTGAALWLEEAYGPPPDGLFARLGRGETIPPGWLAPPGAADIVAFSLYAKAMTVVEGVAPLLHMVLLLPAESNAAVNLQANVRSLLPQADQIYAAELAKNEAALQASGGGLGIGDSVAEVLGEFVAEVLTGFI